MVHEVDRTRDYEDRLGDLWERNLGARVGRDADYFAYGGDSLRATQLMTWIGQSFGVELSLLDFFEARTIDAQARLLRSRSGPARGAADAARTEFRFFGRAGEQLFGALHRAGGGARVGTVLCYPMGQEYMRIHRTYAELAKRVAATAGHALRFDYYGCGDSAGDAAAGSLNRWMANIHTAVEELRDRTGARTVWLVGARIGANLAMQVHAERTDLAGLVLWEPIVNGGDYIAALRRAGRDLLAGNARLDGYDDRALPGCVAEFVGFPISKTLYDEVAAIDVLSGGHRLPGDTLVIGNSDKPALAAFAAALRSGGSDVDYVTTQESDAIWLKEDRQNKGVIPARAVQTIASWLSGHGGGAI
jgi:aryl carrier-like protein